jgi:hypothetical protein
MLRSSYFALALVAVSFLALTSSVPDAFAVDASRPGGVREPIEYFHSWPPPFATYHRFYRVPFVHYSRPVGVGVVFPYDYYPFYPAGTECVFERRPITSVYGLGWRNFIVCNN